MKRRPGTEGAGEPQAYARACGGPLLREASLLYIQSALPSIDLKGTLGHA